MKKASRIVEGIALLCSLINSTTPIANGEC
jgi:hypothetical protein